MRHRWRKCFGVFKTILQALIKRAHYLLLLQGGIRICCKAKQLRAVQLEKRPCQHIQHSGGIVNVYQSTTYINHEARFFRFRKKRTARNNTVKTRFTQHTGIGSSVGGSSQQKHHFRQIMPRLLHACEKCRNVVRLHNIGIGTCANLFAFSLMKQGNIHINARVGCMVSRSVVYRLQIKKSLTKHALLRTHFFHERQNIAMTAEVSRELQGTRAATRSNNRCVKHILLIRTIQRNIGTTKTINALLSIAHRAQISKTRTRKFAYNCQLQSIGILKFIDHNQAKLVFVLRFYLRVIKRLQRQANKVGKVKHRTRTFLCRKAFVNLTRQSNKLVKHLRCVAGNQAHYKFIETRL